MSQTVKAATRTPADRKILALMKKEIRAYFEGLKGARIFVVLVADKRPDWLGNITKTSESDWLATADQDGVGTDLILELNGSLWETTGEESRRGQIGNLLSRAHAKETGKTLQEHPKGNRQLYGVRTPTCGLDPATIERCPAMIQDIPIVHHLSLAVQPGEQYSLFVEHEATKVVELSEAA